MKNLSKKICFLQGYSEGLDLSNDSKEGKVLNLIIDILGEMSDKLEEFESTQEEIIDFIESLDEQGTNANNLLAQENINSNVELELDCPLCKTIFTIKEQELYTEDDIVCPECNTVILSEETDSSFEEMCEEIYEKLYNENKLIGEDTDSK